MELQTGSELHIGAGTRTAEGLQTESDLERLVRCYQEMLLRYCTGILGSREDAEDAVQTAFIKAWKKRNSLKRGASLKSWLYRIAYRASVDLLRTRRPAGELPEDLSAETPGGGEDGFSDTIRNALGTLSALDRAIVEERILEEMPYEEMAAIHRMSAAALRRRYSRARQKLQALLTKEENDAG